MSAPARAVAPVPRQAGAHPAVEAWRRRGRPVDVHGRRVFAVSVGGGDGPAVLVLHGYPTSSMDFAGVLDALARGGGAVVHDHLGFGLSDKPAEYSYSLIEQAEVAIGVWQALGLRSGHLLAHDYGTSIATELLARRERGLLPIDLRSVTLCNGSVHIELARPRPIQKLLAHPRWGPLVARVAHRGTFARNMRRIVARPEVLTEDVLDAMWAGVEAADGRLRLPAITGYLRERRLFWHRWIGALTRLDLPAHVLWGPEDPVALPRVARQLAAEVPGARLTWLPGLGHYPMLEDPAAFVVAANEFLDGVATS